MEDFSITIRLKVGDYVKLMYTGLYSKPLSIISAAIGIFLLSSVALNAVGAIYIYPSTPYFQLFLGLFALFYPPLVVLISLRRFKSNPSYLNDMIYTFREDGFAVSAQTFKADYKWGQINKEKEIKNYLILYKLPKFGHIIDKTKLTAAQLQFIKAKVAARPFE